MVIALVTQAVQAACNACDVLLVNAAVRLGADVISSSYGTPERQSSSAVTKALDVPSVVLTVSTWDDGWFGWGHGSSRGITA